MLRMAVPVKRSTIRIRASLRDSWASAEPLSLPALELRGPAEQVLEQMRHNTVTIYGVFPSQPQEVSGLGDARCLTEMH